MASDSVVRARIDTVTKERATAALAEMGMSVSDAIRLLLTRVAADSAMPIALRSPNVVTREAMSEMSSGGGKRFNSPDALFEDLGL